MFGSQALETVIGLVLMFFIFATAASAITEIYAAVTRKRSKDLTKALVEMFNNGTLPAGADTLTSENVDAFVKTAAGDAKASYLSAKAFADAVTELVSKGDYLGGAGEKLDTLSRQARGRLDTVKAGLETWFDQAMAAVQDRYSKWASLFLLFTGLVLAVAMNASAINVGQDLWNNAAARRPSLLRPPRPRQPAHSAARRAPSSSRPSATSARFRHSNYRLGGVSTSWPG